jgi:hypothetical protein
MRKLCAAVILLLTLYLHAKAQSTSADSIRLLLSDLKRAQNVCNPLEILLKHGSYYLYKSGEFKNDLDNAMNGTQIIVLFAVDPLDKSAINSNSEIQIST